MCGCDAASCRSCYYDDQVQETRGLSERLSHARTASQSGEGVSGSCSDCEQRATPMTRTSTAGEPSSSSSRFQRRIRGRKHDALFARWLFLSTACGHMIRPNATAMPVIEGRAMTQSSTLTSRRGKRRQWVTRKKGAIYCLVLW